MRPTPAVLDRRLRLLARHEDADEQADSERHADGFVRVGANGLVGVLRGRSGGGDGLLLQVFANNFRPAEGRSDPAVALRRCSELRTSALKSVTTR
jgi:hypothetical protein